MFSWGLTDVSCFRKDCTLQMLEMPQEKKKMQKGSIKCELLKIASNSGCVTWPAIKLAYKSLQLCGCSAAVNFNGMRKKMQVCFSLESEQITVFLCHQF